MNSLKSYEDWSDLDTPLDQLETRAPAEKITYPCTRCGGSGVATFGYVNIRSGKCHACNGRGSFTTSPEYRAKAKAQRKAKAEKAVDDNARAGKEFLEANLTEAELVWLQGATWSEFYQDLHQKAFKYGSLSEKQVACLKAGYAKQAAKDAERAQEIANKPVLDLSGIQSLFETAKSNGLKKPALTIAGLRISEAPASGKNAGHLYIKDEGSYAGKITPEGKFLGLREARQGIEAELIEICKNPAEQLATIGKKTGVCCCCGRELTNKISVDLGIGPICASKWGLA